MRNSIKNEMASYNTHKGCDILEYTEINELYLFLKFNLNSSYLTCSIIWLTVVHFSDSTLIYHTQLITRSALQYSHHLFNLFYHPPLSVNHQFVFLVRVYFLVCSLSLSHSLFFPVIFLPKFHVSINTWYLSFSD